MPASDASVPPFELPGLRVTLDRLVFHTVAQTPRDRPHCFVYFLSIHNDSDVPVTVKGRKWVVREEDGEVTVVEGEGVVGQMPLIEPGGHFSYNSFHLMRTRSGVAEGAFLGLDASGRSVFTRIAPFRMVVPGGD